MLLAGAVILAIGIFIWRALVLKKARIKSAFDQIVLQITIPKEGQDINAQQGAKPQEAIAKMEAFYTSLANFSGRHSTIEKWFGHRTYLGLEIVVEKDRLITWYATVPKSDQQFLEQQIRAQFPSANIEETTDYNLLTPSSQLAGMAFGQAKNYVVPFLTYRQVEADQMNAVLSILAKLQEGETAVIQLLLTPAKSSWHKFALSVIQKMQEGAKLDQAVKGQVPKSDDPTKPVPRPGPTEEEIIKGINNKAGKAGFDCNVRVLVASEYLQSSQSRLKEIQNAFVGYNAYNNGNDLKIINPAISKFSESIIFRSFNTSQSLLLSSEELASLLHFPLLQTEVPNIRWLAGRRIAAPAGLPTSGTLLGVNVYGGQETNIFIMPEDRLRHLYVIGGSGTGKSVLMGNMALQDIAAGHGICVIDPHGDLVDNILSRMGPERADDVIIFDAGNTDYPMGLNMLEFETPEQMDLVTAEMIAIFYKLFSADMIGPMFEHNMRNAMLTLMADKVDPGTIAEIPRIFTDQSFVDYKLKFVTDPVVRNFWENEMAKISESQKNDMLGYLISKVGRFVENEMMRNVIGQQKSGFNFRKVMDEHKILMIKLSKGKIGDINSELLGSIIVSKLQMAALSRADMPEKDRQPFFMYIDEFQNYVSDSIAVILSEARKYGLSLTLAHQNLTQLIDKNGSTKVRDSVMGNAGTKMVFRVGVEDASVFAKEFAPVVTEFDLVSPPMHSAYLKLLVKNMATRPFVLKTLWYGRESDMEFLQKITLLSQAKYNRSKPDVSKEIIERSKLGKVGGEAPIVEPTV